MKAETQILDGYWGLLSNLNPNLKLKLIERLSKSVHKDLTAKGHKFEKSFGAWYDSRESAHSGLSGHPFRYYPDTF